MTTLPAPAGDGDLDFTAARTASVLSLDRIQEGLLDAFLAGRGSATVLAYRRDLEDFRGFVARQEGLERFGVDAQTAARMLIAIEHGQANALGLAYRADMVGRGLQPATVNRRLSALRSVVKLGNTLGLIGWRLDVENVGAQAYRDTRGPGRDGVRAMMAAVRDRADPKGLRDTAILRLLHDVALRRGEVVSLDVEHYDRRRSTLAILGKGRTQREPVTLPPATRAAVDAWLAVRPVGAGGGAGPLFVRLDRAGEGGGRLTGEAVRLIVKAVGSEAGLKASPHKMRHAAITAALDASNGNIRAVQRFSRHRDVRVVQTYDDSRTDLAGRMATLIAED